MGGIALLYSTLDPAGSGIASIIGDMVDLEHEECKTEECVTRSKLSLSYTVYLAGFNVEVTRLDMVDREFPGVDRYIVLSKHQSVARRKTLSVHHTGNPTGDASHGGRPYELSLADAHASKVLLTKLAEKAMEYGIEGEYSVTLEATHHGPTGLVRPLTFIEIGSTIDEWSDPVAREVVALTVLESLTNLVAGVRCVAAAGFGGGHYPVKHTRIQLESDYCLGHILAKYVFTNGVREDIILQSLKKTVPEAKTVIIEKKSLRSAVRKEIVRLAESMEAEILFV